MSDGGRIHVQDVLSHVGDLPLPHPASALLSSFVLEALNPEVAADYVQRQIADGQAHLLVSDWIFIINSSERLYKLELGLSFLPFVTICSVTDEGLPPPQPNADAIKAITRRDGHKCCVSGKSGSFWDPLIVAPILPVPSKWASADYEVDHVLIGNERPIAISGKFALLGDHSRSGIDKSSFSGVTLDSPTPIPKSPQAPIPRRPRLNQTRLLSPFLHLWLLLPATARIAVYELLRKLGHRLYGLDDANKVQRLPFGLYPKYHGEPGLQRNEFHALKMIQQHTTIPAPRALDIVSKQIQNTDDDFDPSPTSVSYLLISRVPGITLAQSHDALSDQDFQTISIQMKHYISQIRDIPKIVNPQMAICNTLGEACRDHRIKYADPIGPFPDEASFSQQLRYSDEPSRRGHRIVFTHADLNPHNILVDKVHYQDGSQGWQISGILDWETAGYYPKYWDFTKAMYEGFRWPKRYNDFVKDIFAKFGDYSRELEVEKRSWASGDG